MSSDIEVDDHAARIEVTRGQHLVSSNRYNLPSEPGFTTYRSFPYSSYAGLAPVPYTGRNFVKKISSPSGTRTSERPVARSQGMMP